jgi:hypothetical protein
MEQKVTGRAAGGKARSEKMTPEERSASASKAAMAKVELAKLPTITHEGKVTIGDVEIPCYVTADGSRVLSARALQIALNMTEDVRGAPGDRVDRLLAHKTLSPLILKGRTVAQFQPIKCRYSGNPKPINGYGADVLADICEGMLVARKLGLLKNERHQMIAEQCEILLRGFARVGIIALIDEATGYQKDRAKNALAEILEKFVAKELQPWVKTFPAGYYEHLFRLYGIKFPPEGKPQWRPSFFGHITNNVVYDRIAPELLPELKKLATKAERKARLHQCLTSDIGHPKLREHLASIVTLLKISSTPEQFKSLVDQVHPRFGDTYSIDFTMEQE